MTTRYTRHFDSTNHSLRTSANICLPIILLASFSLIALAQTASRPDRGIRPVGAYSVSDIENISMTNGNVNLSIPLAALPPMAGDKLALMLSAKYNSKLWDKPGVEISQAPPIPNYTNSILQLGDGGGWRLGGRYGLTIHRINEDYQGIPPADNQDPDWYLTDYKWKMILTTPDGAKHELRRIPSATGRENARSRR